MQLRFDAEQLGIAVVRPQHGVVFALLVIHVLEVDADEDRELPIQPGRRGAAGGAGGCQHQRIGQRVERIDVGLVMNVLAGHLHARSRRARFERRVHEAVLMRQVVTAQVEQFAQLAEPGLHVGVVIRIQAADAHQGVGHEGSHRLMDEGIHVVAGRGGGDGRVIGRVHACVFLREVGWQAC